MSASTTETVAAPTVGLGARRRLRLGAATVLVQPRGVLIGVALALIGVVVLILSVATGTISYTPGEVIEAILGGGKDSTQLVVQETRLPRALTALLAGGALGASGAILQSVARNPLASPDIVGFTQGAGAAAVLQIVVLGGGPTATAIAALLGGFGTAAAVYLLAHRRGSGVAGYRLLLVGIGAAATMAAITSYLLTRAEVRDAQQAFVWLTGSLHDRTWADVRIVALGLVVLLPLALVRDRGLRILEMGDDAAQALGLSVQRSRAVLLLVAVALAGAATASAGPVLFVGLAAPQIARRLARSGGPSVALATLTGAVLMALSDLIGQRAVGDTPLPVGVVTGVLGGAYLIWLLTFERRARR